MPRFPFASTPAGWYQVAYSDDLPIGAVRPLDAFGRDLVAYRGEDGVARVLDAYCPHLGAHLGHGGMVTGACIRCPFHGWAFDGQTGHCVDIPGGDVKIPPGARALVHPSREVAGLVLIHHDESGAPPAWEADRLPGLEDPRWAPAYFRRAWRIRSHVQDIAENLVDAAHFSVVHGTATRPVVSVELEGPTLLAQNRMGMRTPRGLAEVTIDVECMGLGLAAVRFRGIVDTLLILGLTPAGGELVDLRLSFRVAHGASFEGGVGAALIADVIHQTEEDIRIWEHKIYRDKATLCALDRPLATMRTWARQFYRAAGLAPGAQAT